MLYKNLKSGIIYPFAEELNEELIELFFNSAKDMRVVCDKHDVEYEDREFEEFEYFFNMDLHMKAIDIYKPRKISLWKKIVHWLKNK